MRGKCIQDLTIQELKNTSLVYSSPCRGLWNIVHLATQVPSSHQIFVCPTSCLRGVVLTTAEMGAMDRLSTITVGEDNILEGDLEETILYGTRKILETIHEKPRVVFIFTSCIHHFMAANFLRVYKILRKEYPDIDFIDAYMNPIMRKKTPPLPCLQRQVYRMLKPTTLNNKQVNFIDNWFAPTYNDLYDHCIRNGIIVKDFSSIKTYDAYLQMAASSINFHFHNFGKIASKDMHLRLRQQTKMMALTFDYDAIDLDMQEASELCHIPCIEKQEIEMLRKRTEEKVQKAKQIIKDTPIAIDQSAIDMPFTFAYYLLQHGFHVDSIYIESFTENPAIFFKLQQIAPYIKVYCSDSMEMRTLERNTCKPVLAIGQQAAYFNQTKHFVNVIFSSNMYGYKGIQHLFDLMIDAYQNEKDIELLVSYKGWGCCAR